jgi:hypothetical protein
VTLDLEITICDLKIAALVALHDPFSVTPAAISLHHHSCAPL